MVYDFYILAPECIRKEIEYIVSTDEMLRGIKSVYFAPSQDLSDPELIMGMIRELKCDNDILLLCDMSCSYIPVPEQFSGSVKINRIPRICTLFADRTILENGDNRDAFIIIPGWLENWEDNLDFVSMNIQESGKSFSEMYSSILILDTGLHSIFIPKAEKLSGFTGLPFKVMDVGLDHFKLAFENMVIKWTIEKKQNQLKVCNRKVASYAMSIDFIKTIADMTEEYEAIESICKLFSTMFAPRNVVYYSFYEGEEELRYCKLPDTEKITVDNLKDSDANYLIMKNERGFAIKVSTTEDLLGIVEIHDVTFPEYLDEYLSVASDLSKASGLAISNIRRYHEVFKSREEQVKLAEMLRTTNRILRHDITNNLQVITGALELLEEKKDEKYFSMIRTAAGKSVSIIHSVQELDALSGTPGDLRVLNLRSLFEELIARYSIDISLKGNCSVKGDNALSSVFDNIIGNAIMHGHTNRIDIEILSQDNKCTVSIADNGTGIPDKVKPRIFDEGYKYGESGHTGFGLYIAKKTIERYKGSIRVEDNIPSGAKFVIEFDAVN